MNALVSPPRVLETRALIASNSTRVRDSRALIAHFWSRRRAPWPRIAGGSGEVDGELRDSVRARLLSGALFPVLTSRVWGGPANGSHECIVCKLRIGLGEMEYEQTVTPSEGRAVFAHLRCFDLWHVESAHLFPR